LVADVVREDLEITTAATTIVKRKPKAKDLARGRMPSPVVLLRSVEVSRVRDFTSGGKRG